MSHTGYFPANCGCKNYGASKRPEASGKSLTVGQSRVARINDYMRKHGHSSSYRHSHRHYEHSRAIYFPVPSSAPCYDRRMPASNTAVSRPNVSQPPPPIPRKKAIKVFNIVCNRLQRIDHKRRRVFAGVINDIRAVIATLKPPTNNKCVGQKALPSISIKRTLNSYPPNDASLNCWAPPKPSGLGEPSSSSMTNTSETSALSPRMPFIKQEVVEELIPPTTSKDEPLDLSMGRSVNNAPESDAYPNGFKRPRILWPTDSGTPPRPSLNAPPLRQPSVAKGVSLPDVCKNKSKTTSSSPKKRTDSVERNNELTVSTLKKAILASPIDSADQLTFICRIFMDCQAHFSNGLTVAELKQRLGKRLDRSPEDSDSSLPHRSLKNEVDWDGSL